MTRRDIDYPFHVDGRGRTAAAALGDHVRDLIEQVLFTAPGERINRPDFGAGLNRLIFAPNGVELAGATELLVQASLQQWLGDLIVPSQVTVTAEESVLRIVVEYSLVATGVTGTAEFTRGVPA
jgi:phage baseplate assembly protein W